MFYSLTGKLIVTGESYAVIECGGVAFKLTVSSNTLSKLTRLDQTVCLYTHMSVREDSMDLFGFFDTDELDAFKLLTTVSGVGAKAGMSILSVLTPSALSQAVSEGNIKEISRAHGVASKTASRIILELKDKIGKHITMNSDLANGFSNQSFGGKINEAQDALVVLGYKRNEASEILKKIDCANLEIEDIIREALKMMMK